ncbi:hypothetical protein SRABI96_04561 [Peribacillus sp. Bi96]|nr:hypothetical protein SRABI96_04561 [Peribacillus sp. Bi96]
MSEVGIEYCETVWGLKTFLEKIAYESERIIIEKRLVSITSKKHSSYGNVGRKTQYRV